VLKSLRPADNPFRAACIDALTQRPAPAVDDLIARLEASSWRGAIVGGHGSGKSTIMDALARRLGERAAPVTLTTSTRPALTQAFAQLPAQLADRIVLLDGAEQLGVFAWYRFRIRCRATRGLVVTQHKPGRLTTVWHCRPTKQLLTELVAQLAPELVPALAPDIDRIWRQHPGDLRTCLQALYDRCAAR
jgi:energy-coupling factor transporter ATP-binding protein EcfA2